MTDIPSDEDFARAKRLMRERYRNIDKVEENARQYFKRICPFRSQNVYIFAEDDLKFRAYVFFKEDKDIQECENNGTSQAIQDFIYEELERQRRGKREDITVAFEFDSDENVTANYEGDYFLRLR